MLRTFLFDHGYLEQRKAPCPVISVGNLAMGGTGKTPMVEHLIDMTREAGLFPVVISRGYRRRTRGPLPATPISTVSDIGDEPLQIYHKYQGLVPVIVSEDRRKALPYLPEAPKDQPMVIILDDAFQHRYLQRDCNILLTTYSRLYTRDHVFPFGRLRESRKGARRADIIIVTKCPADLSTEEAETIRKELSTASGLCKRPIEDSSPSLARRANSFPAPADPFPRASGPFPPRQRTLSPTGERWRSRREAGRGGEAGERPGEVAEPERGQEGWQSAEGSFDGVRPPIFFSAIEYAELPPEVKTAGHTSLITGIAHPEPLLEHLAEQGINVIKHLRYPDHHRFTNADLATIRKLQQPVLTTEKDAARLPNIPEIYALPIQTKILFNQSDNLNNIILNHITQEP